MLQNDELYMVMHLLKNTQNSIAYYKCICVMKVLGQEGYTTKLMMVVASRMGEKGFETGKGISGNLTLLEMIYIAY